MSWGAWGLGGVEREDTVQVCVGAQALHTHSVCPPACPPRRIVCTIEAAEVPFTGGVEVDVNGKLGRSPPDVLFTYQVGSWQVGTGVGEAWAPPDSACGTGEARTGWRGCVPAQP